MIGSSHLSGMVVAASIVTSLAAPRIRAQEPASPQADAITAVQKAGGKVEHEEMKADKPVIAISFATTGAADDALATLTPFADVQKLTLNNTKVTDAGLDQVKTLSKLQKLYLVDTAIGDAGVEKLKDMPELKILSLAGSQVTDACLPHIEAMKTLETVFLAGTKVTDDAVKKLQEARPGLKVER